MRFVLKIWIPEPEQGLLDFPSLDFESGDSQEPK